MLIHYLYRDEPDLARWQSGLETVKGQPKPALQAASLPLAEVARHGSRTVLWGQVRPGSKRWSYVVQRRQNGRWATVGGKRWTTARGYFAVSLSAPRGSLVRVVASGDPLVSPPLVVH